MIPEGFRGSAVPRSPTIYAEVADVLDAPVSHVQAIVQVEAGGEGFLADRRPKILYERHKFYKFAGSKWAKSYPDICNARPGGYLGGPSEYDRLTKAIALNRDAALLSFSIGLPQIMTFNHVMIGYDTPDAMIAAFCAGEDQQLWGFCRFIQAAGLEDEVRDGRWADLAKVYNGPANVDAYSRKLVAAFAEVLRQKNDDDDTPLKSGRAEVAEVQAILVLLGYGPLIVDGWNGPKTIASIKAFQASHGLPVGGIAGPDTRAALFGSVPTPPQRPAP